MIFVFVTVAVLSNYILLKSIFTKDKALPLVGKAILNTLFSIGLASLFYGNTYVLLAISILFFFNYYYSYTYGEMSYGSVASIFETNTSEAMEFLKTFNPKVVLKVFFVSSLFFMSHWLFSNQVRVSSLAYFACVYSLLSVVGFIYIYAADKTKKKIFAKLLKHNGLFNSFLHIARYLKYKRMTKKIKITSAWTNVKREAEESNVYIVIIGESARRDNFHVYGYPVMNTPSAAEMKGYTIIEDAYSPATQTMLSIPRILAKNSGSEQLNLDLNIIDLANDAGFNTYWISNQGKLGAADTDVTMLANRAQEKIFLQADYSKAESDFKLLDEVRLVLDQEQEKQSKQPTLIFLHTMGSHSDFSERSKLGKYHLEDSSDTYDYDNTIYNTYRFIEDLRDIAACFDDKYQLCYFSDHGLAKIDEKPYFTHAVGKLFSYDSARVPLFFVGNRASAGELIRQRYYLRDMVHSLADWMGIQAHELENQRSILSRIFQPQKDYVLDDAKRLVRMDSSDG